MKNKSSVITLIEAIHSAMLFSPIKIYYNRKLIWDDTLSIDGGLGAPKSCTRQLQIHPQ